MANIHFTYNGKLRLIAREEVDEAVTAKEIERRRRIMYHKMQLDVEAALAGLGYQCNVTPDTFSNPEVRVYFEGDTGGPEGLK